MERFEAGQKNTEVAAALRVSERSAERWRRAWRELGDRCVRPLGQEKCNFDMARGGGYLHLVFGDRPRANRIPSGLSHLRRDELVTPQESSSHA